MTGAAPVFVLGPLVRDVVFLHDSTRGTKFRIGSRGGGSPWNVLINAAYLGAKCEAVCVAGSDLAARESIRELSTLGVEILDQQIGTGRRTKTLHELLELSAPHRRTPKHLFSSRCPVCGTETYRRGTPRTSRDTIAKAARLLTSNGQAAGIIHMDGLDRVRFDLASTLRRRGWAVSVDLGRSTGLHRLRGTQFLDRLLTADFIFVHHTVERELYQLLSADSLREASERLNAKCVVVTRGAQGLSFSTRSAKGVVTRDEVAVPSESVVDTAGAGDALIGSFLSEVVKNFGVVKDGGFGDTQFAAELLARGQAWAARKCSYVGARGHIAGTTGESWSWDDAKGKLIDAKSVDDLALANLSRSTCISCDSLLVEQVQQSVSTFQLRHNILRLPGLVEAAWSARHFTPWPILRELRGPGYAVGTGGSFAAAYYTALLLESAGCGVMQPVKPFDYVRTAVPTPLLVVLSHSGQTADVEQAIQRAKQLGVAKIVVIAGVPNPPLALHLDRPGDSVLLAGSANPERGFLSFAGVALPAFFGWAVLHPNVWDDDLGFSTFQKIYADAEDRALRAVTEADRQARGSEWTNRNIVALGGGYGWPAVLDFESKLVEGNMGHVEVSEMKDYSHGRFMSSIERGCTAVIFGLPDDVPYRQFLVERLKRKNVLVDISTTRHGPEGGLDLLLTALHLVRFIAERKGVDAAKPEVPKVGLELYRYTSIFDFENSHQRSGEAG